MRVPRIGIAWGMTFIALVALDFGVIRALSDLRSTSRSVLGRVPNDAAELDRIMNTLIRADLLGSGALPMANILAVALISYRRGGSRPFLLGFAAFGAAALALFIAGVSCLTDQALRPYLELVVDPLRKSFGPSMTTVFILSVYSSFAMMLTLPQVAVALIGGFLFRRFRNGRAESPSPLLVGP